MSELSYCAIDLETAMNIEESLRTVGRDRLRMRFEAL
jgi:hypothetical protein